MSTMYGADVAELRALAAQFERTADLLDDSRMTVGNAIQISAWVGPFAARFRIQWDSEHSVRIHSATQLLRAGARTLRGNADEQDRASAAETGAFAHGGIWPGAHRVNVKAPSSAADLVRGVAGMEQGSVGGDGVRIQKVLGDDGEYRYIVYVDGTSATKDGLFGGDLSLHNNVFMMANADNATMDHVRAKIRAAMAGDEKAEVAIVGFSQGGLVAQGLADEREFNVKTVLTYGSPTLTPRNNYGGADLIRLEHNSDMVPGTDVVDLPQRIGTAIGTALAGGAGSSKGEDVTFRAGGLVVNFGTWGPHNHNDYAWVAEQFEKSTDPTYGAAKKSLDRFAGTVVADEK